MIITAMQDLQQRPTQQLRMMVGLREPARAYPGTESGLAGMRNSGNVKIAYRLVSSIRIGAAARQQAEKMRLPGSVRPEHCNSVAEPDLRVERPHQTCQLEVVDHDRTLAGTPSAEPH